MENKIQYRDWLKYFKKEHSFELSRFMDIALAKMCKPVLQIVDSMQMDYLILVYNSYCERKEDALGRYILFSGLQIIPPFTPPEKIMIKSTSRGQPVVTAYMSLEHQIRRLYKYKPDSEFNIDEHCQISVVTYNVLAKTAMIYSVPHEMFVVGLPIHEQIVTGV